MSNDELEKLIEDFEKWDAKHSRQAFIKRMERKLQRKEKSRRYY